MHCSYLCHDQSIGDGERGKEGTERGHEHVGDSSTLGGTTGPYAPRAERGVDRTNRSASGDPGGLSRDFSARSELAALLEKLGQLEEALFNWNAVLTCDPNSLNAREGVARCRQRTRPPLQSAQ